MTNNKITMLQIQDCLVHLDIIYKNFACNLNKCKGVCCVYGDSGAPIEKEEDKEIKNLLPVIFDSLTKEAQKEINAKGVSCIDFDGELTTMTVGASGPCVFTQFDENNIAYCTIERAYEKKLVNFQKPKSCLLYPIRIKKYTDFTAVNYHIWSICSDAVRHGDKKSIPIYIFLKDALTKTFGKEWYEELCLAAKELRK